MRTRFVISLAIMVLLLAFASSAVLAIGSWPMFRQNDQRTGVTDPISGVLGSSRPKPIWVFPAPPLTLDPIDDGGTGFASTAGWTSVSDPFGTSNDGDYMYALSAAAASDTVTWTFDASTVTRTSDFFVYVWLPSNVNIGGMLATKDARYTVEIQRWNVGTSTWDTLTAKTRSFTLDQTNGETWVALGISPFQVAPPAGGSPSGDRIVVTLSNLTSVSGAAGNTVVIADAVKLVEHAQGGSVTASPVTSDIHSVVLTSILEQRSLENASLQDASRQVGVLYGVNTEDLGATAFDDRGTEAWRFPANDANWIGSGISSSPAIWAASGVPGVVDGTELAAVPAQDGQVYVVQTQDGIPVWHGPGYTLEDPTATADASWATATNPGYQGATGYLLTPAVNGAATTYAAWTQTVATRGTYYIYAWIPPSLASGELHVQQATYQVTIGADTATVKANQRNGGRWVALGSVALTADNTVVNVQVFNNTTEALGSGLYVVADAIKIVPSDIGSFDLSSAVVGPDGTIYAGNTNGRVYALTIGSPDAKWTYPDPERNAPLYADPYYPAPNSLGPVYASPTLDIDGATLYVGSSYGTVYAINAADGTKKWTYPDPTMPYSSSNHTLGQISSTTVVNATDLYVAVGGSGISTSPGAWTGRVVALDKATGAFKWVFPDGMYGVGAFTYSSPLLMQRPLATPGLFVGSTDGHFYGIDPVGGAGYMSNPAGYGWTEYATYPFLLDSIYSSPAGTLVTFGAVFNPAAMAFVGTEGGRIYGVNLQNGLREWWWDLLGSVSSSPAIANDRIYVGDRAGYTTAFSARTGGEDWNSYIGYQPTSGSESTTGRYALPEIDVMTEAQYNAFMASATSDPATATAVSGALHDPVNRGDRNQTFEWGEKIYIIVWNLLDPNTGSPPPPPGDPAFIGRSRSTVKVTLKSVGTGDASDASETFTIRDADKGWFYDANNGNTVVYFARYVYSLDGSQGGKTQTPGTNIAIAVTESPGIVGDASGDSVVPTWASVALGRDKYQTELFAINNPLAFLYVDPNAGMESQAVGVTSAASLTTSRGIAHASENGNPGAEPYVRPLSLVGHGRTSGAMDVFVYDRSLLGLPVNAGTPGISRLRMQRYDMTWTGGPLKVLNSLPWETIPPYTGANRSTDYPDIGSSLLDVRTVQAGLDPTILPISLPKAPLLADPGYGGTWDVGAARTMDLKVRVPRFQPPNYVVSADPLELRGSGYITKTYVFVDSNNDGRLNTGSDLGSTSLVRKSVTGTGAEAYRQFFTQVMVSPDKRVETVEKMIDIGAVPQGFGVIPPTLTANLDLFGTLLNNNARPLYSVAAPNAWDAWFKDFTAYNIGNMNLLNIKVWPSGSQALWGSPWFVSDTVQSVTAAGTIPAGAVVSTLDATAGNNHDTFLAGNPNWAPLMTLTTRTFHKPRVGENPSVLQLPDAPDDLYPPGSKKLPSISVAVPIGTPVGTYHGFFTVFDDANGDGAYNPADPAENIGEPIVNLGVTVTESRLTGGISSGSLPQIDMASAPGGDQGPAPYIDESGNLHLFWSSTRGQAGTPNDPWYLFGGVMPWGGVLPWSTSSFQYALSPTPTAWWAQSGPFPDPATLATLFPVPASGTPYVGAPGTLEPNTVQFTSPSVAELENRNWLVFQGSAYKSLAGVSGSQGRTLESRIFYSEITGGALAGIQPASQDWTMAKFGVRGMATPSLTGLTDPSLWTFWYGGTSGKWRMYYNVNTTPNDAASWTSEGRLSVLKGMTSVSDPSPIYRPAIGTATGIIDVIHSGYSDVFRNSDIYLTRYQPGTTAPAAGTAWAMAMMPLAPQTTETLQPNANDGTWRSKHVAWLPGWTVTYYPDRDNMGESYQLATGTPSQDPDTGVLIYRYKAEGSTVERYLFQHLQSAVIDPMAGTVKLGRRPGTKALFTAAYIPVAYRLTTDEANDVSPFALLDDDPNPLYFSGSPFFWIPTGWTSTEAPTTDRLWLFWRRPGTDKPGTGIFYKTFRWMASLNPLYPASRTNPNLTVVSGDVVQPVEIDPVRNRLYFTGVEEGKAVTVTYVDTAGATQTQNVVVQLTEDMGGSGAASFGNLTSVMVNEGQVNAVKDKLSDKVWVFWVSTRGGGTDIYYEAISPRFYAASP